MAPSSNDTDPMGRPPLDEGEERERKDDDTTPSGAPNGADDMNATDPDPRPVIGWDPPTDNPRIRAIFENIKIRPAPPPVESPITNGELAVAYSSGVARPAPAPNPTPPPQPAVIVAPVTPVPEQAQPVAIEQPPQKRRSDADERNATDPDPRPVLSFDIPTDNPRIRAMFDNMKMRRAPPPIESPITNGELAAAYSSNVPRPAPAPNPTPPPQPPVILAAPTPVPEPTPLALTQPAPKPIEPAAPQQVAVRRRVDAVTVRIERPIERPPMNRRGGILTLSIVAAGAVAAILSLAVVARGPREVPVTTPTALASKQPPPPSVSIATAPPPPALSAAPILPSSPSHAPTGAVTVAAPHPSAAASSLRTRGVKPGPPATSKNHEASGLQNWLDE